MCLMEGSQTLMFLRAKRKASGRCHIGAGIGRTHTKCESRSPPDCTVRQLNQAFIFFFSGTVP